MAYVRYHNFDLGIKKFVVFEIGRNKYIRAGSNGLGKKKAPRSTAYSHFPDRRPQQCRMAYARSIHCSFQTLKKRYWFLGRRQFPDYPGAGFLVFIFYTAYVIRYFFIGMGLLQHTPDPALSMPGK